MEISQILTNDDEVCTSSLSSILLAVNTIGILKVDDIFGFLHRFNYIFDYCFYNSFYFQKKYHCSEWMIFVAPLRRYFFPILDSVDRKKKDFCINLRHVMRSDVIQSNERIHGIIVLHHKIENMAGISFFCPMKIWLK